MVWEPQIMWGLADHGEENGFNSEMGSHWRLLSRAMMKDHWLLEK